MLNWNYGINELSQKDVVSISFPDGVLLKIIPSEAGLDSMKGMQKILYMLRNYSGRFSFEIWKDGEIGFHFFTSAKSAEMMLRSQFNSIYPQSEIKKSKTSLPSISEGECVSSCSLLLMGSELNLRCPEDFHYDPLRHVIESLNQCESKAIVQILFERVKKISKDKKPLLAHKYGDDMIFHGLKTPILNCLIRFTVFSKDRVAARENMEMVARTFSVFDSDRCQLFPDILFFPIVNNSKRILKSMNKRQFPLFSNRFLISVPELASMVHLPVRGNSSVEYSQPPLSNPW